MSNFLRMLLKGKCYRDKSTGSANENASQKYDKNLIVVPFIYAIQKWLLTTEDPKRGSVEVYSTFLRLPYI